MNTVNIGHLRPGSDLKLVLFNLKRIKKIVLICFTVRTIFFFTSKLS